MINIVLVILLSISLVLLAVSVVLNIVQRKTIAVFKKQQGMLHHKMKNDLQILISMFNLQSALENNPRLETLLSRASDRVYALSQVHQFMYKSSRDGFFDVASFTRELGNYKIRNTQGSFVGTVVVVGSMFVSSDESTALGLFINEALDNAVKYGFNKKAKNPPSKDSETQVATVTVGLYAEEQSKKYISIQDEGPGVPEKVKQGTDSGLGMTLMKTLANQLGGTLSLSDATMSRNAVILTWK